MKDLELAAHCLARDESAWRQFFARFKPSIDRRIKQIFFKYGYSHTETQFLEALDYVLDQFIFNRALDGFRKDLSLESYVLTVTTRATIDWYRSTVAEKRLFGAIDNPVLGLPVDNLEQMPESSDDVPSLKDVSTGLAIDEQLFFRILLLRFYELTKEDVASLVRLSGRSEAQTRTRIASLQTKLQVSNSESEDQFNRLQVLFFQVQALRFKPDQSTKLSRRERQFEDLLDQYRKRGFEVFPTRVELSELCNWDINKTDRILRKLRERLQKNMKNDRS